MTTSAWSSLPVPIWAFSKKRHRNFFSESYQALMFSASEKTSPELGKSSLSLKPEKTDTEICELLPFALLSEKTSTEGVKANKLCEETTGVMLSKIRWPAVGKAEMQPLSGNLIPDVRTCLMRVCPVPRLLHEVHLCSSSTNIPRLPGFWNCNKSLTFSAPSERCRIRCACHKNDGRK